MKLNIILLASAVTLTSCCDYCPGTMPQLRQIQDFGTDTGEPIYSVEGWK